MRKIAVIDGDSICYICSKDTIVESLQNVDSIMNSIGKETGSSDYYLFLSQGSYFRHEVNLDYKGKRKYETTLKYLRTLKSYLREEYGGVSYKGVEADDMSAYVMCNQEEGKEYINCSPDKDVLKTVWGPNFNYRSHESGQTSVEEAIKFIFIQTLMGDSTDNIAGLPGIGPKKAEIMLDGAEGFKEMKSRVLDAYQHEYGIGSGIYHFQKNFRQVYLLRTKSDFQNEVRYVPELPELQQFRIFNEEEHGF
jgi:hypothetical protein